MHSDPCSPHRFWSPAGTDRALRLVSEVPLKLAWPGFVVHPTNDGRSELAGEVRSAKRASPAEPDRQSGVLASSGPTSSSPRRGRGRPRVWKRGEASPVGGVDLPASFRPVEPLARSCPILRPRRFLARFDAFCIVVVGWSCLVLRPALVLLVVGFRGFFGHPARRSVSELRPDLQRSVATCRDRGGDSRRIVDGVRSTAACWGRPGAVARDAARLGPWLRAGASPGSKRCRDGSAFGGGGIFFVAT
jgi:hypothetical protein